MNRHIFTKKHLSSKVWFWFLGSRNTFCQHWQSLIILTEIIISRCSWSSGRQFGKNLKWSFPKEHTLKEVTNQQDTSFTITYHFKNKPDLIQETGDLRVDSWIIKTYYFWIRGAVLSYGAVPSTWAQIWKSGTQVPDKKTKMNISHLYKNHFSMYSLGNWLFIYTNSKTKLISFNFKQIKKIIFAAEFEPTWT